MTEPSPGRITITAGHVARHTPRGAGAQGRDAALVDIAQDLLLRDLHQQGLLDDLVFKGGTALRKLYAGNQGRFSLDLDFSVAAIGTDPDDILELLDLHVEGLQLGPFRYAITERRGKRHLQMSSTEFGVSDRYHQRIAARQPTDHASDSTTRSSEQRDTGPQDQTARLATPPTRASRAHPAGSRSLHQHPPNRLIGHAQVPTEVVQRPPVPRILQTRKSSRTLDVGPPTRTCCLRRADVVNTFTTLAMTEDHDGLLPPARRATPSAAHSARQS